MLSEYGELYRYDGGNSAVKLGDIPFPSEFRRAYSIAYSPLNDSFYIYYYENFSRATYRIPKSDITNSSYVFSDSNRVYSTDGRNTELIRSVHNVPYTDLLIGSSYGDRSSTSDNSEVLAIFNDSVRSKYGDNFFLVPNPNNITLNKNDTDRSEFNPGIFYREEDDLVFASFRTYRNYECGSSSVHTDLINPIYIPGSISTSTSNYSAYSVYVYPSMSVPVYESYEEWAYVSIPIQAIGDRVFYAETSYSEGKYTHCIYFTDENYPQGDTRYKIEFKGYIYKGYTDYKIISISYLNENYYLVTNMGYMMIDFSLNSSLSGSLGDINSFVSGSDNPRSEYYHNNSVVSMNGDSIIVNKYRGLSKIDKSLKFTKIIDETEPYYSFYSFALENE